MNDARRAEFFYQVKDRYLRFLSAVLWRLSGDREIFAEAMQYALMGMWEHVEKLDGPGAQSYIYRIALSANGKAWRDRVGREDLQGEGELSDAEDPVACLEKEDLTLRVRQAIAMLPEQQGQAILLRYVEQRDYAEVAEHLVCSPDTARSHVSKAVAMLKKILAPLVSEVNHEG